MFVFGILNVIVWNVYAFIGCRFLIGFFLHGTYPQLNIMLSEITGQKKRAFASNIICGTNGLGACLMALKAYLLREFGWKKLFLWCSAPYSVVLVFYFFVPESVRFLQVKGRTKNVREVLRRIAYWNNTNFPEETVVSTKHVTTANRRSTPLDLFRGGEVAMKSFVFGFTSLTASMTFYSMYLAASSISGHIYRDVFLISMVEVPVAFVTTPLLNR